MYRRRNLSRTQVIRRRRPTERIIRQGVANIPAVPNANVVGYVFTAKENGTASNIKLETLISTTSSNAMTIPYAVVYIPEGYDANTIAWPAVTDDLYNPTKYALITGILFDNQVRDNKSTRYSRKMVPGDRIALIYRGTNSSATGQVAFSINFTYSC